MKAETPAQGILKTHDWGDTKMYRVVCDCGNNDHEHQVSVEAAETGITVETYITVKSNWWQESVKPRYDIDNIWLQEFDWFWKGLYNGLTRRIKLTWTLWTKGYVEYQTCITMNEQQALNYAETLKTAINDVKSFKKS